MTTLHLVCNAHLDPVWQWEWEEGAAAAVSTFRVAADLCDAFDAFIFNHNEALLYRWVEEYEPALFARIQRLVAAGRWHIMGGWYIQPDCNMPNGESLIRQLLLGRQYFAEKFGVVPTTAINFDSFGHSRGLVQILAKSGYDSYLFCRPDQNQCPLPADDFRWVGFDGSTVLGHRSAYFYNSALGKAHEKVQGWLTSYPDKPVGLMLWGVGNHGGGPSRLDLERLTALLAERTDHDIRHSTPEAYFRALRESGVDLPEHAGGLNSFAVGCYTSQIRIKQRHRQLENELYLTEKMLTHAALTGGGAYPLEALREVARDLCFAEFHDVLPGSSVQPVEETSLRLMDHGLEILSRLKARAFFSLAGGQPVARTGEIPILVYNPHPYPVRGVFECEFMLADQNWTDTFTNAQVYAGETLLPSQVEKELSNLPLDWRKRVAFAAELAPGGMNRFDCRLQVLPARPTPAIVPVDGQFLFHTEELEVVINAETGLLDRYCAGGVDYLRPGACLPLVIADDEDPWGMRVDRFNAVMGHFALAEPATAAWVAGLRLEALPAVRVIEDGPVRTTLEAIFTYGHSFLVQQYKLPKRGTEVEISVRVIWNEKDTMLKYALPIALETPDYRGQVVFGHETLRMDGREAVAQQWVAAVSAAQGQAFSCINDGVYGSDYLDGTIRLSLLRSSTFTGHPIHDRPIVPQDRFTPRIDQGERLYRFWLNGSGLPERLTALDREARAHNEQPYALSFFPSGDGVSPQPFALLDDAAIQLVAAKGAEDGQGFILRLFEPTGQARTTRLTLPLLGLTHPLAFGAFEVKTLRVDPAAGMLREVGMAEEPAR
jgi:alpha-mannosidase